MIKTVVLKRTNTLDPNAGLINLNFSEHVNVIIGPKGGGKSTLFDLVASLNKGYIPKNVINALNEYKLEFVKAILFNGEEISGKNISQRTEKEKEKDFIQRNDVIFQDDPIKKNINNNKKINDAKKEHIKSVIANDQNVAKLIKKIEDVYNEIASIINLKKDTPINWNNTFSFVDNKSEIDLISRLNYNDKNINEKLINEITAIKRFIDDIKTNIAKLNSYVNQYDFDQVYVDDEFNKQYNNHIKHLIENNQNLLELLKNRLYLMNKIQILVSCFKKSFCKELDFIKSKSSQEQRMKTFEKVSIDYFKNFAVKIAKLINDFKPLLKEEYVLQIDDKEQTSDMLSYKVNSQIIIDEEIMDNLLKTCLYSPGKSVNDISKWINANKKKEEELEPFNYEMIQKKLADALKDQVKVYADGKDYETMSLGEKSIYGIKYKFVNSMSDNLFLDQPEDNLDNNTIASKLLEMIKTKQNNQLFIVTHNANIGILSKPKKIIVADLNNQDIPYYEGKVSGNGSESTLYLEGGIDAFNARSKIIKGDK